MKKSVDFGNGIRGKHEGMSLTVLGSVKTLWAVCLAKNDKDLIPFKLYRVEVFSDSEEIRLKNENGETANYPGSWFASLDVSKKTLGIIEKAA